ncbi:MAG: hypothetical protein HYX76_10910 [Acidobacteria bacterium]|nr:hypothetical protein [Acidobacteriota bacterium]
MTHCPACNSSRIYPSRTRSRLERLRRFMTKKRPYRCHHCDWRGWGDQGWEASLREDLEWPPDARRAASISAEELDSLDPGSHDPDTPQPEHGSS